MKTTIIQKAVILNDGKLLALKRSDTDVRRPLQWDLPGGWLDAGEDFFEGIRREVHEETGLNISGTPALVYTKTEVRSWQNDSGGEEKSNCLFLFYIVQAEGTVQLSYEHVSYEWMELHSAVETFEYALHKEALHSIIENELV